MQAHFITVGISLLRNYERLNCTKSSNLEGKAKELKAFVKDPFKASAELNSYLSFVGDNLPNLVVLIHSTTLEGNLVVQTLKLYLSLLGVRVDLLPIKDLDLPSNKLADAAYCQLKFYESMLNWSSKVKARINN